MKLTPKQKAFADYYIQTLNATESAKRAGYSERYLNTNASKLLQNTTIKNYIDERMNKIDSKRIADANEVLEFLTGVMRTEDETARYSDKLKAAELLGKRHSLFVDKVEQTVKSEIIVELIDDED